MSDSFDKAKQAAETAKVILDVAKETPELREAGTEIAKAVVTVSKAVNVVLLPVAAVNFGYEKARTYFNEWFKADIEEKMSDVPSEHIIEPKISVAAPALQGLAFAHEEEHLKEMFLNLIKSAMDSRTANNAHPSFPEIIKHLSAHEALHIRSFLRVRTPVPIVCLRETFPKNGGHFTRFQHLVDARSRNENKRVEFPEFPAMVDNWVRLGLVSVSYTEFMKQESRYSWVEKRPEYQSLKERLIPENKITVQKGVLEATAFGESFARIVVS